MIVRHFNLKLGFAKVLALGFFGTVPISTKAMPDHRFVVLIAFTL
jgi:hypothetical protein